MPPKSTRTAHDLAIIGNDPHFSDIARDTDRFRRVVRFNNAAGFGSTSGQRISELVLVSRGGQAAEWLADPGFVARPAVRLTDRFTLVFPPTSDPGAECVTEALTALLETSGKPVRHIEQRVHNQARHALQVFGAPVDVALSSGFVFTFQTLLERAADAPPIDVFGFSFQGWEGHAWHAEKRWFEANEKLGRLTVWP